MSDWETSFRNDISAECWASRRRWHETTSGDFHASADFKFSC